VKIMKKAISSFVATVLLIGFTVAVGAILSVWFTTFTRTQTTAVQSGAACASNPLYVRAIGLSGGTLTLLVSNSGSDSVTITSAVVTCGGALVNSTNPNLPVSSNSQNTTTITGLSGCTQSNLGVILTAVCGRGGTTSTACPEGTCFS
jgi:archaellum component FlaG (FlaF/FlaG flagellin family)